MAESNKINSYHNRQRLHHFVSTLKFEGRFIGKLFLLKLEIVRELFIFLRICSLSLTENEANFS